MDINLKYGFIVTTSGQLALVRISNFGLRILMWTILKRHEIYVRNLNEILS